MPRRQYAPVPVSQGDAEDADRQIEEAFDIGDEDHDDQNHDHTPLLARHDAAEGRTPHTSRTPVVNRPTTSGGLYNFEYDFPPPGSPPADLAIANSWGNTNGIVVSDPVHYNPNARGNWATRAWRRLIGTGRQASLPEIARIGGGTNNDGVFSNLSSRPTARINRPPAVSVDGAVADDGIYHAPELARDDIPPSYAAAQADTAPPYWENTVLATTPDDFLIDSIPAGSLLGFVGSMALSVFLEWIGFILAYMLSQSHAGRYGARAGLGITFVRLGLWFRARGRNWDGNTVPEEMWWPSQFGNGTLNNATSVAPLTLLPVAANSTGYANFTGFVRRHLENNSTVPGHTGAHHYTKIQFTEWLSLFLMTIGWFIFMSSLLGFWRVKRWESSIRASSQPRVITPEEQQQERELFTNLQTALGGPFIVHPHSDVHPPAQNGAEMELRELEEAEGLRSARSGRSIQEGGQGAPQSEEDQETARFENRLRRDLTSFGYM